MIKELEAIGLTNGESRVYKALCEIGESSAGPICDASKVHRSIIYQVLEKLLEKGIISVINENGTKKYQAAPPNVLLQFVEQEQNDLERRKENLVEIFPTIVQLQASGKRSTATLYSGFQGVLNATFSMLEILKEGEEYFMVHIPAIQPQYHNDMWDKFHIIREERKIKARHLYNKGCSEKILKERNARKGMDARIMPVDFKSPPTYYAVFKNVTHILLSQGETPITIEIINKDIADGFRAYFEWLWKQSKPFKK